MRNTLDVVLPILGVALFTTGAAINWRQQQRRQGRTHRRAQQHDP